MERGLLIAGQSHPVFTNLVQEALARGARVVATRDRDDDGEIPDGVADTLSYVPWNPRSLFSSRTLVLETVDRLDRIDDVIVVMTPEGVRSPFHQTESAVIEKRIDDSIKGWLFLVKEALSYLMRNGAGRLVFLLYDGGAEVLPPVDSVIHGGLTRFVESIFAYYAEENVEIHAYRASGAEESEVAPWLFDSLDSRGGKSGGRWGALRTAKRDFRRSPVGSCLR